MSKSGFGKAARLLRVAPRRPREFAGRISGKLEGAWDARTRSPSRMEPRPWRQVLSELLRTMGSAIPLETIASELERVDGEVAERVRRLPADQPMAFTQCAIHSLARSAYAICRILKPELVVETGVAYGMTSAYILSALAANESGVLHSIDLPPLGDEEGRFVGSLIAEAHQSRWRLHRGTSRQRLRGLLEQLGSIDLFIHDSLHTERTMLWEFDRAWARLPEGGVLLSDDIQLNRAFERFAARVNPRFAAAVGEAGEANQFGVALK